MVAARAMQNELSRRTFVGMKASGRAQALDLSLAVIGVALTAVAVWSANGNHLGEMPG